MMSSYYCHPNAHIGPNVRIGPFTVINEGAYISEGCIIRAGCTIDKNVIIGKNTRIGNQVCLQNCQIGAGCFIHDGVKIGQDGFGFHLHEDGKHEKKLQELKVIVYDDVEIGANTTIDRGSWRNTIIGEGSKLDNLIQIGHNVEIGKFCVIAAQTGIAGLLIGSTTIGENVHIGGQVGIVQHLNIGNNVKIAAKSAVFKDLICNNTYGGIPAKPIMQYRREVAYMKRLFRKKNNDSDDETK